MSRLELCPVSFKEAKMFVERHHRHNKPPVGWKFGVGVKDESGLVGIAMASRPISRHLDDGVTLEISRTCTKGAKNANSMLYGAIWRAAKALGYIRCVTYTQSTETGASLRAVGWIRVKNLPPRKSWAESSVVLRGIRDPVGNGGVARVLWEIRRVSP